MNEHGCEQEALTCAYALGALTPEQVAEAEAHVATCAACARLIESMRPVVASFGDWPADILRPSDSLWERLSGRIAPEAAQADAVAKAPAARWSEPDWDEVAPGISCKILASDVTRDRVTMLVRLAPGVEYPAHRHAGTEELHLLDGELWIQDKKLMPGDYYLAEAGSLDTRVWSETGCTCVLTTSPSDTLRA